MSTGSAVASDTGSRIAFQDAAATSLFQVVAPKLVFVKLRADRAGQNSSGIMPFPAGFSDVHG